MIESPQADNLKFAIATILVVCFALSLGDALIKQQSASFGLWQIFLMRSVIAIPCSSACCAYPGMPLT